ncbi:hypothetical protein LguiB_000437 [Lonicera macranthoides]
MEDLEMHYRSVAIVAVTKFKKVISLLNRTKTGHARFRRAPVPTAMANSAQNNHYNTEIKEPNKVISETKPLDNPNNRYYIFCKEDRGLLK